LEKQRYKNNLIRERSELNASSFKIGDTMIAFLKNNIFLFIKNYCRILLTLNLFT
jgi:hypothetical protein